MTYDPRPNASGDTLSSSRDPIRTNFIIIRDDFAIDHVEFDDANEGKHSQSTYIQLAASPAPGATESALYSLAVSGNPRLFLRQGATAAIQMGGAVPTNATDGFTFLPGGLLIQWNTFTATASVNTTVTFPTAFGDPPYSVICQMNRNNTNVDTIYAHTLTATTFLARNTSGSNRTTYYIAIGTA